MPAAAPARRGLHVPVPGPRARFGRFALTKNAGEVIAMRLWTVHPSYLDSKGLVAVWREALLAQKVLSGATRGYRHHPQLIRFQAQARPRGYRFDASKIPQSKPVRRIAETDGQLLYEWGRLRSKLRVRAPLIGRQHRSIVRPKPHPLFRIVPGGIRDWERPSIKD